MPPPASPPPPLKRQSKIDFGQIKIFGCEECKKQFSTLVEKQCHVKHVHKHFRPFSNQPWSHPSWDEKPFSCVWCEWKFSSINNVRLHTRSVHEFNCNDCMKELVTWEDFLKHSATCASSRRNKNYFIFLKNASLLKHVKPK